jgi:hypothetical protein
LSLPFGLSSGGPFLITKKNDTMKCAGLFMFMVFAVNQIYGQSLYVCLGKTNAKIQFKDTEGSNLAGLNASQEGAFWLGARTPIKASEFHVSADVSYQRYINNGSEPVSKNYYAWDATFVGLQLGIDYEFLKPKFAYFKKQAFSVCAKLTLGPEFLLKGTQNVNNQLTDLKGADEFDKPFFYARGGVSGNYYFSKEFCAYIQYLGGKSFLLGDYSNQQQAGYITHSLMVGFAYSLVYTNVSTK